MHFHINPMQWPPLVADQILCHPKTMAAFKRNAGLVSTKLEGLYGSTPRYLPVVETSYLRVGQVVTVIDGEVRFWQIGD